MVKLFYDLETTGLDYRKHSIHQIAGYIEIDNKVVESFNMKVRPHPKAQIDPAALRMADVTEDQILAYPEQSEVFRLFKSMLAKYINKFDPKQKAWQVGFNNRAFDDKFLRMWFDLNKDDFYNSWFWSDSLDVMVLASQYLIDRRSGMQSFKLKRVSIELGIEVEESKLHDAFYDVFLTRKIYRIVTGLDLEI